MPQADSEVTVRREPPPDLPYLLRDLYPGSEHIHNLEFTRTRDLVIWGHDAVFDFVVTTKDKDFLVLSERFGYPPKLILVQSGNQHTSRVEADLRSNYDKLQQFHRDDEPVFYLR